MEDIFVQNILIVYLFSVFLKYCYALYKGWLEDQTTSLYTKLISFSKFFWEEGKKKKKRKTQDKQWVSDCAKHSHSHPENYALIQ